MEVEKKRIFYFEDDPQSLRDYYNVLNQKYEVQIGAHRSQVEQERPCPVDLIIVDLMIHREGPDLDDNWAPNLGWPEINWQQTGVEFIRRLRAGEYEAYGLLRSVPIIVATASVDYTIRDRITEMGVSAYMEKPFSLRDLERVVDAVLMG